MHKGEFNTISFESMADLADYMKPIAMNHADLIEAWSGNVSDEQALHMLRTGDTSQIRAAEKMMAQFQLEIETTGTTMTSSVAGFSPNVPAYLGGSPESMFDMLPSESNVAPLKVIVDPSSTMDIDADMLAKRGAAILAAVMALSATRPVQLEICTFLDANRHNRFDLPGRGLTNVCLQRVTINSAPLDLPTACYALCHQGFTRKIMYGLAKHAYGSPLVWWACEGVNTRNVRDPRTVATMLQLLGEDEANTLLIPNITSTDVIAANPTKWVSAVLAKYGQQELA